MQKHAALLISQLNQEYIEGAAAIKDLMAATEGGESIVFVVPFESILRIVCS